jgi:hypothetical protein
MDSENQDKPIKSFSMRLRREDEPITPEEADDARKLAELLKAEQRRWQQLQTRR